MPSISPLLASAIFKKMMGPLATIVLMTSEKRTTIKTEHRARKKWHFLLLVSRNECFKKKTNEWDSLFTLMSYCFRNSSSVTLCMPLNMSLPVIYSTLYLYRLLIIVSPMIFLLIPPQTATACL
jgi:hypothetical protein